MAERRQLWGGETAKAIENFPISGETVPVRVVRWLARLKSAAAAVNGELELLPKRTAARIERAAGEIAQGRHDDQFPIDVFQTGSGTSTNTNANEVIASLAGAGVHPNDHVNMGQSSNDVFPSAVHLAALEVAESELLPALKVLERSLARKARAFEDVVKAGRTHLMDAVPVTLGQEFSGYAAQIALGAERVRSALAHVGQIPLGGTATGTGLNTHPRFAEKVRARLRKESGLKQIAAPLDPFEALLNIRHARGIAKAEAIIRSKRNSWHSRNFFRFQQPRAKVTRFEAGFPNIWKKIECALGINARDAGDAV